MSNFRENDCKDDKEVKSGKTRRNKGKTKTNNRNRRNSNSNSTSGSHTIGGNESKRSDMNDPTWYKRYPELADDASKFPFSLPLGKPLPIDPDPTYLSKATYCNSVPGVMQINWFPTIGISDNKNSAANIASRELYSFVRHANSGHNNYDAPDLMMYVLAMDSAYSMYAAAVRAYGTIMLYNGMNRYVPKYLIEAQGFDFDDISQNLAQFRWYINQMAYKLSALYVPAGMTYYDRHIWMNSTMFVDGETAKAQTYIFRQNGIYIYDATKANDYQVRLKYVNVNDTYATTKSSETSGAEKLKLLKVADFVNMMDDIINPILADEAMNIMSGDILKAFGSSNLFIVSPISEDYVTVPVYSREVMSQIQNLTIMGHVDNVTGIAPGHGADIIQKIYEEDFSSAIIQTLSFSNILEVAPDASWRLYSRSEAAAMSVLSLSKILTCEHDNANSDEIIVATRLMNICPAFQSAQAGSSTANGEYISTPNTCSTEVVTNIRVWSVKSSGEYGIMQLDKAYLPVHAYDTNKLEVDMALVTQLAAFDWHPTIPMVTLTTAQATSGVFQGYWCETMDYTTLTSPDLERLHETCLYSMFQIPDIRKLSSKPY